MKRFQEFLYSLHPGSLPVECCCAKTSCLCHCERTPHDLSPASQRDRPQLNTWHTQESEAIPHQQLASMCIGDCFVTRLLVSASAQAGHGGEG
jgi:hypothetical protein